MSNRSFWHVSVFVTVFLYLGVHPAFSQDDCMYSNHNPRCWNTGGIPRGFTAGGPLPARKLKSSPAVALPIPAPIPQEGGDRARVCWWSGPQYYGAKIPHPANVANGCPAQPPRAW